MLFRSSAAKILLVLADNGSLPNPSIRTQLLALPGVTQVDIFDGFTGTPALALLQTYDVVAVWSNNNMSNATAMGDVIADYLDAGGKVVAFNFVWYGVPFGVPGRWMTGGYSPFNDNAPTLFTAGTLGTFTAGHPLMQGVSTLNASFRHIVTVSSGSTLVASWNDSRPLIAFKGKAVGINAYVGNAPTAYSGDFANVIVNAGTSLGGGISCPGTPRIFTYTVNPTATINPVPNQVVCNNTSTDRKSTRLNSSHERLSRMPSSA